MKWNIEHEVDPDMLEVIYVTDFTEQSAIDFCKQIRRACTTGQTEVVVQIFSGGGCVSSLMTMVRQIQDCPIPVITAAEVRAYSCGFCLFLMGNRRIMSSDAVLLHHPFAMQISHSRWFDRNNYNAKRDILLSEQSLLLNLAEKNCELAPGYLSEQLSGKTTERFYVASEALEHGFATETGVIEYSTTPGGKHILSVI